MTGTIVVLIFVVMWIFVLAPWVLRRHKPMSKAGDAFEDTRVIYEGGTKPQRPPALRPKVVAEDKQRSLVAEPDFGDEDAPTVPFKKITSPLVSDKPAEKAQPTAAEVKQKVVVENYDEADLNTVPVEIAAQAKQAKQVKQTQADVKAAVAATTQAPQAAAAQTAAAQAAAAQNDKAATLNATTDASVDLDTPYDFDDSYLDPEDLLYPTGGSTPTLSVVPPVVSDEKSDAADYDDDSDELTEEDIEFAKSRRGRGGYDPEADKKHSADRYQRRRSTILGLLVAIVVTVVPAFIIGSWMWVAPGIVVGLTLIYLIALRAQVKDEERLRHKRVHQLRRTRAGVRNTMDRELGIPHRLRRPGAVVLETDDDSPDFIGLELVDASGSRADDDPLPDPAVQYDNVIKLRVG